MRIFTTTFLLACAVLVFSAQNAFAVIDVTITQVKHACGGANNGSFVIRVNTLTGVAPGSNLNIQVFGSGQPAQNVAAPLVIPGDAYTVTNLAPGINYLVVVTDASGAFDNEFQSIFSFNVIEDSHQDNTDPDCSTPNGSISVTASTTGGIGPVTYAWSGPNGFNSISEDLLALVGGDYTLNYTVGTQTCTLGPIHINDPGTPFVIGSAAPDVCAGDVVVVDVTPTADVGWTYDVMEGASVVGSAVGAGAALAINVPGLSTGPHSLTVRASAGACTSRVNGGPALNVTVSPKPVGSNSTALVCSDQVLGINIASNPLPVPAASFDISVNANGLTQSAGTPSDGTDMASTEIADDAWTNTGLGNVDVVYTIIPVSAAPASCTGTSFTITVTVQPQPVGSDMTAAVCSDVATGVNLTTSGGSVAALTYNIALTDDGGLIQSGGTVSAGTGKGATELSDDVWRNTGLSAVDVIYTVVPVSAAGCLGNSFTVTVTIDAEPVGINTNITLCSDVPLGIDIPTDPAAGTADHFTIAVNPNGLIQSAGTDSNGSNKAANETFDDAWRNTGLLPVNVIYTITPITASLCSGDPFTLTVRVEPEPVGTSSTVVRCTDQTVNINLTTSGASVAADHYTISVNSNGLTQIAGTDSDGTNKAATELADDLWENLTNGPVDVEYTITPMSALDCAGDDFTVTVTINPEPVGDPQVVTVCSDDLVNVTLGVLPSSVAATMYNIAVNPNGLVFAGTTPSAGPGKLDDELEDDQWTNNGLVGVDVVYTITPVSAAGCDGTPFTVTVTVDPGPQGSDFAATRCSDELLNVMLSTSGSAVAANTYDIAVNPNGLTFSGTTPSGGTGKLADELADDSWTNIGLVAVDVIYTITPLSASSCAGDPFTLTVTVRPEPVGAAASAFACSDVAVGFTLSTNASSVAADTYNISFDSHGLVQSGGTVSSGTGKLANELADDMWTNTGTSPVLVEYTIVPVSSPANGLCSGDPFIITITIRPEPVGANDTKTICSNSDVDYNLQIDNIDALGSGLLGNTFSWTVADNANVSGEMPGPGPHILPAINDILINNSSVDQPVVYTVTPSSSSNCAGTPFTVTITVRPEPVLAVTPKDICTGSPAEYEIKLNPANMPAGTVFSWSAPVMSAGPAQGTPGVEVPMGAPGTLHILDVLTNTTAAPITATYTVTPSFAGGICPGAPQDVIITIYPAATADAGNNQFLCTDTGAYVLAGSSVGGVATNHTWTIISEPTPLHGAINPLGGPLEPFNDEFLATIAGTYVLRLDTDPVPVCGVATDQVTITVINKPAIAVLPDAVCTSDPVDYEVVMTSPTVPPTTVLNWPVPVMSNGSSQGTPGSNVLLGPPGTIHINDILINNGSADITATYTITPTTGLCVGLPVAIVITVRPGPDILFGQSKTICSGDLANKEILLNPANTPPDTKFSWPDPDGAGPATSKIDVDADPAGTIHITDQLFNGTAAQLPVRYQVIATGSNGCSGVPRDVFIMVDPGATVEAGSPQSVCSNGTVTLGGADVGGVGVTKGTWSIVSGPTGGVLTGGTDTTTPELTTFRAAISGSYTLRLTTEAPPSCPAVFDEVVITVRVAGDPSCTGGSGLCPTDVFPNPTPATCTNSDGAITFDIQPNTPPSGDIKLTVTRTVPASPPTARTVFVSVHGFTIANLPAGQYTYDIEFGTACTMNGFVEIPMNGTIGVPTITNPIDPLCFGGTGAATIDAENETGNVLQWSSDGITFTDFIAGSSVTGLPSGSHLISVRKAGDPCAGGAILTLADPTEITATLIPTDATCFNNDGSIAVNGLTGGTGPYTFQLNGDAFNLPASNIIPGLTAGTYDLIVTDAEGCEAPMNPVTIAFPGYINFTTPVTTSPDCSGGGANGKVEFTITDPGSFQFAFTNNLVVEPTTYDPLGGSLVSVSNIANGDYAIWIKPMGAGTKCSTKVPVTISGVYAVSYTSSTSDVVCFAQPTSIVLTNIRGATGLPFGYTLTNTANNSVTTGTITAAQALSTYSITNVTPGNYSILLTQDQSSLVPSCTSLINGGAQPLVVSGPSAPLDSLYVKRAISFPDLPSGSALVGVNPSGLEPYETRLELTTPLFGSQEFVSDWSEVAVNPQNLKFESSYTNLFAGVYTLGIRDAGGCERTYVFTLDVDTNLFIPNMFSPNGDGHNEVFYIRNLPENSKLLITNRWGKEVFKSSAYTNDWNGGDTVDGTYFYTLTLGSQKYSGWIEIMRGQ